MKQNTKPIISIAEERLKKIIEVVLEEKLEEKLEAKLEAKLKNYPTRNELDSKFEKFERKIDDNARLYRDQILNKMDGLVGEQAQIREDNLFRDHEIKELQKKVDQHDIEITKLKHS